MVYELGLSYLDSSSSTNFNNIHRNSAFLYSTMDDKITALENRANELQLKVLEEALKMGKYRSNSLRVDINEKGRSVFSKIYMKKGDFVCYYEGNVLSKKEGLRRIRDASTASCYYFFFKNKEQQLCIDATSENYTFGRLINHSRKEANLKPYSCQINGQPKIGFKLQKDILPNTELLYNYGETDPLIISQNPWLRS